MMRTTLALFAGFFSFAAEACPQDPTTETAARLSQCIRRLSSDDFQEREAASAELAALPTDAIPLIEAEVKKGTHELEVRSRLEAAIPKLRLKAHREASARKKDALRAWTRKTAVEAYEHCGQKDERWNAKVREALELVSLIWAKVHSDEGSVGPQAYKLCVEAIQAGCQDPLVLFARARMYDAAIRKDFAESLGYHLAAAKAMKESGGKYHPIRQASAYWRAADYLSRKKTPSEAERDEGGEWLELALGKYALAARDSETPDYPLLELGEEMTGTWKIVARDRKVGMDKVFGALAEARPDGLLPMVFKGQVYIKYAWDARGSGWANTVKEQGWKLFGERLAEAEGALTKAWEKDPQDPQAPTLMLTVELGQGKGRGVMETWFKRAMEADPNNHDACKKKMYYLEPKWHGSAEEMIAFGRELLAGGNFEARLPFGLTDAHVNLAGYIKDPKERQAYYKSPEVWKDVRGVYEPYLKIHPNSAFDRSWYAKLACLCGQYEVARAQFESLGDKGVVSVFGSKAELDRLKSEAADKER